MPKSKHRIRKQNKPKPIKWKSDEKPFQVPVKPHPTVEFPRPESNSKIEFTFLPLYPPNHPKSKIPRSRFGGQSAYDVRYILSIPGVDVFKDKIDFRKFTNFGDSLLQFGIGEYLSIHVKDDQLESEIQFLTNNKGILSQVRLRIKCDSFEVAERFSHERISLILSYWSFIYDVGIEISSYLIIEENTGIQKYQIGLVGKVKAFNNELPFIVPPEYRRILAAYREAMNSSNLFYQALSFFKVIEGTQNLRKKEKRKIQSVPKGTEFWESNEKFPDDISELPIEIISDEEFGVNKNEITEKAFTKYLGMTFRDVRDDLADLIRNAVAHLGDFEKVLDADRYDDVVTCSQAIPVLKLMARKMLENDFEKLNGSNNE